MAAMSSDRLDEDIVSELRADAQASIANETDEIGMAAEELDALLLAKAQLAQTKADLGRAVEAFNANGSAGDNAAQRTDKGIRANGCV